MAGGGFKKGHIHGATDELGYKAVKDRVSVPDLMATVLAQLGVDHNKLAYPVHGIMGERRPMPRSTARRKWRSCWLDYCGADLQVCAGPPGPAVAN